MAQGEPRQETIGVQSGDGGAYVDATACCTRRNKGSIRRFRLDFDCYGLDKGQMTMDDGRSKHGMTTVDLLCATFVFAADFRDPQQNR